MRRGFTGDAARGRGTEFRNPSELPRASYERFRSGCDPLSALSNRCSSHYDGSTPRRWSSDDPSRPYNRSKYSRYDNQMKIATDLHKANRIGTVKRWFIVCYCSSNLVSDNDIKEFISCLLRTAPGYVGLASGPSFVSRCELLHGATTDDVEKGLKTHLSEAKESDIGIVILKQRWDEHFEVLKKYFLEQKINRQCVVANILKEKNREHIESLLLQINKKVVQWPDFQRDEIEGLSMHLEKLTTADDKSDKTSFAKNGTLQQRTFVASTLLNGPKDSQFLLEQIMAREFLFLEVIERQFIGLDKQLTDVGPSDANLDPTFYGQRLCFINSPTKCLDISSTSTSGNRSSPEESALYGHNEFIAALCNYLHQIGFTGSQINVLCTCQPNIKVLKEAIKDRNEELDMIYINHISHSQSPIVILDIASQKGEQLPPLHVLKTALERSSHACFIFADFDGFKEFDNSLYWSLLLDRLKSISSVDLLTSHLTVSCIRHKKTTRVACATDFDEKLNAFGGCADERCVGFPTRCGHECEELCHPHHRNQKCLQLCAKKCPNGHSCVNTCWDCVSSHTVECPAPMDVTGICKHKVRVSCCEYQQVGLGKLGVVARFCETCETA